MEMMEMTESQQDSTQDPPLCAQEPHDGANPRFILAQKTGVLADVIPLASLKELAPTLRVLNLEQRSGECTHSCVTAVALPLLKKECTHSCVEEGLL